MLALLKPSSRDRGELNYSVIKTLCKTHGAEGETVYGIEAYYRGYPGSIRIEDISADPHDVERLIFRLKKGRIWPDHLFEIVEDYIVEINS